ncbi:MAG: glutaminase A [Gammaproteobacteria bacterium]|nr:glutaminase A [Gammaproteobacteria bacterium]MDA7990961.1 glutaminase A [Gammaproteobacteria bacterium]MDA8022658.1 glutaminase A [Gammaproteobacteria bacterium]
MSAKKTTEKKSAEASSAKSAASAKSKDPQEQIYQRIFSYMDLDMNGLVSVEEIHNTLAARGYTPDNQRVREFCEKLKGLKKDKIDLPTFKEIARNHIILLEKALSGGLVIPDFQKFTEQLETMFAEAAKNDGGQVADYIPQLAKVPPKSFALSVCTVDGQRWSIGESGEFFSIQSTSKPFSYCIALEAHGRDKVHKHVGREPSGQRFNEIVLNRNGNPHNPMINAGAIVTSSLVRPELPPAERFDFFIGVIQKLCGETGEPVFNNAVYLSEKETADRNYALAYFMRENKSFPKNFELQETMDFYMQCCSVEMSSEMMATAAATLAFAGICPTTGERVFSSGAVKDCLSMMSSCGMYDYSGEFAFRVGMPAKSGVGGCVIIVVPNLLGMCIWSPPLDEYGNSVRGVQICQELVNTYNFHTYDSLIKTSSKKTDPRMRQTSSQAQNIWTMIWAASQGDLDEIRRLEALGVDINEGDYDGRTPLHLAVAEGQAAAVQHFVSRGAHVDVKDRWGETPMQEAKRQKRDDIIKTLSGGKKSGG